MVLESIMVVPFWEEEGNTDQEGARGVFWGAVAFCFLPWVLVT